MVLHFLQLLCCRFQNKGLDDYPSTIPCTPQCLSSQRKHNILVDSHTFCNILHRGQNQLVLPLWLLLLPWELLRHPVVRLLRFLPSFCFSCVFLIICLFCFVCHLFLRTFHLNRHRRQTQPLSQLIFRYLQRRYRPYFCLFCVFWYFSCRLLRNSPRVAFI